MFTPWPPPRPLTPYQLAQVREDPSYFALIAPTFIIRCLLLTLAKKKR